jgi:hypothetical protein
MNGPVFRIWVLLLALLVQAGGFRSEASSRDSGSCLSRAVMPAPPDFDISEQDDSQELSAADDALGGHALLNAAPEWCRHARGSTALPVTDELPPGRSPSDAPFKPPRG